jgi:hypothetical protein
MPEPAPVPLDEIDGVGEYWQKTLVVGTAAEFTIGPELPVVTSGYWKIG